MTLPASLQLNVTRFIPQICFPEHDFEYELTAKGLDATALPNQRRACIRALRVWPQVAATQRSTISFLGRTLYLIIIHYEWPII